MNILKFLHRDVRAPFLNFIGQNLFSLVVFGVAFLVFFIYAAWSVRVSWLFGDEPHYVAVAQSMVKYGTINTTQVYRNKDYWDYHGDILIPDTNAESDKGQFSVHWYLLPTLITPAVFLGEKLRQIQFFVVIELATISALGVLLMYKLSEYIFGNKILSALTVFLHVLSIPFVLYSHLVFPDLLVGWLLLFAVYLLWVRKLKGKSLYLYSIIPAALIWLHIKNLSLAGMLVLVAIFYLSNGGRFVRDFKVRVKGFLVGIPLGVAALAYLLLNWYLFGSFSFKGSYGPEHETLFSGNPMIGILGNFFDQGHGLLLSMPIFVFLPIAAYHLWREKKTLFVVLLVVTMPFYLLNMTFFDWFGGYSPPTRYVMTLLPVYSVLFTAFFKNIKTLFSWGLVTAFGLVQLGEIFLLPLAKSYMFVGNTPNDLFNSLGPKFQIITKYWPSYFFISDTTWKSTLLLSAGMLLITTGILLVEKSKAT